MLRINKADRYFISQGYKYYSSTTTPWSNEPNNTNKTNNGANSPSFEKLDFKAIKETNKQNNNGFENQNLANSQQQNNNNANNNSNNGKKFNFNFSLNLNNNKPKQKNNSSQNNKTQQTDYTAAYKSPPVTSQTIFQPTNKNSQINNNTNINQQQQQLQLQQQSGDVKNLNMFQSLMKSTTSGFNFMSPQAQNSKISFNTNIQNNNISNNNQTIPNLNFSNNLNLGGNNIIGGKQMNVNPSTTTTTSNTTINTPKFNLNINPSNLTTPQQPLKFNNFNINALKENTIKQQQAQQQAQELKEQQELKKQQKQIKRENEEFQLKPQDQKKQIIIPKTPTPESLSQLLSMRLVDFIKWMIKIGLEPKSVKELISDDVIDLLSQEFNFTPLKQEYVSDDLQLIEKENEKNSKDWIRRPPVVTIVGHIDHGKTSLLDYLRNTTVVQGEAGRITQHIGAFEVKLSTGEAITFMDTPGHAAFSTMRERGVQTTDIALLIVAGDDGVQEQTIEAIRAIEKAKVQVIVVINKIDKPGVDTKLVKQQLLEHNIAVEGFGGSIPCVEISAKTGQGINQLEETILLLSEVMDLKAPLKGRSTAVVLESTSKKNRGIYSTLLVKRGTIKIGDWFLCGNTHGKIKEMRNHLHKNIQQATPGTPVEVFGFKGIVSPSPGDELYTFENEKSLMTVVDSIAEKLVTSQTEKQMEAFLQQKKEQAEAAAAAAEREKENLNINQDNIDNNNNVDNEEIEEEEEKEVEEKVVVKKVVNLYVKGDFGGSTEAIVNSLKKDLPMDPEITVNILRSANGEVTEKDLTESSLMKTPLVYFGPPFNGRLLDMANKANITVIQGDVIYHVIDGVARYLESQLDQVDAYDIVGVAKVQQVFPINKTNQLQIMIAGCKVTEGKFKRGSILRIKRDDEILPDAVSTVDIIKHFKETVKEIAKGQECGIATEKQLDFQPSDQLLAINLRKEIRKLGAPIKPKYYNKY